MEHRSKVCGSNLDGLAAHLTLDDAPRRQHRPCQDVVVLRPRDILSSTSLQPPLTIATRSHLHRVALRQHNSRQTPHTSGPAGECVRRGGAGRHTVFRVSVAAAPELLALLGRELDVGGPSELEVGELLGPEARVGPHDVEGLRAPRRDVLALLQAQQHVVQRRVVRFLVEACELRRLLRQQPRRLLERHSAVR
eukprot:3440849-Rhodomonas_salina.1